MILRKSKPSNSDKLLGYAYEVAPTYTRPLKR